MLNIWSQKTHQDRIFMIDAFISHAAVDIERVQLLIKELVTKGLRVWPDDEQRVDDACWTQHREKALYNSRFVIVIAGPDSDLMDRRWIPFECKSAIDSEASLPGISRLLVGRTTPDIPVPTELAHCKQFDLQGSLDELVAFLQAGNLLPPLRCAPSTMLLAEARTLLKQHPIDDRTLSEISKNKESIRLYLKKYSRDLSKLPEQNDWRSSKQRLLQCLTRSVSDALVETEKNLVEPSLSLYHVWVESHTTLDQLDEPVHDDEVQWLIPGLEALTAVGHTESQANACFGLRCLATCGASAAAAALRRVVVRAENETIVRLVVDWFGCTVGLDWNFMAPEDCARVLLKLDLTNVELREELFARLTDDLRIVALPAIVAQTTRRAFDQSVARVYKAQDRFEELRRNGRPLDWEIYFRGLAEFVGFHNGFACDEYLPLQDRVDIYLTLVSEFAHIELDRGSNMIWRIMYEPALLMPLAELSAYNLYRDRATTTYYAVLDAMEAPVLQDMLAQHRRFLDTMEAPVLQNPDENPDEMILHELFRTKRFMEQFVRLKFINALRCGPYFDKSNTVSICVRLISEDDLVIVRRMLGDAKRLERENDTDSRHDAWAGVPIL
jgi:hypothetical protein